MKKYLFTLAALAAFATPATHAQSVQQIRNQMMNSCTQSARITNNSTGETSKMEPQAAHDICTCALNETSKQYGSRWTTVLRNADRGNMDSQLESRLKRNLGACMQNHFNR